MRLRIVQTVIGSGLLLAALANPAAAQETGEDFFESRIRPLLVNHCVSCHGPDAQESGLRLDTGAALATGGDSGPIIRSDQPTESLLLNVVHYDGDIQMPPDGKLKDDQIRDLETWVAAGAPWPKEATPLSRSMAERLEQDRKNHWSLQPITRPQIPQVDAPEWQDNPIDALIAARLESHSLTPSDPADDRTLVRRLHFDLLGLPATSRDVQAYLESESSNRWSELVDTLLQRPQYGERWGRYWLDVARYADTQGYAFAQDRRYPHAYTYRDYVIESFNQDKPFDRFVMEQLAADQLDLGEDNSELAALGFITVGRKFINHHDTIDDRIDVVTRGLMGLTVSCARCHDHKYDAIPTEDYYSLYGVFASTEEPEVKPVIGSQEKVSQRQTFEARQRELQAARDQFRNSGVQRLKEHTRERLHDYLLATVQPPAGMDVENVDQRVSLDQQQLRPRMVRRWRDRFQHYHREPRSETAIFQPFGHLMALPDHQFAKTALAQISFWQYLSDPGQYRNQPALQSWPWNLNADQMPPEIIRRLIENPPQSKQQVAQFYANLIREIWKTFEEHGGNDKAVLEVEAPFRLIIDLLRKPDSPLNVPPHEIGWFLSDADHQQLNQLQQQLDTHNAAAPPELPRAMAVQDRQDPFQPYVFIRGSDGNRGPDVPRRYLAVLTTGAREPFPPNASGRLQLARRIVAEENPLTARVIANRVWMHHFGSPLVDTPSDFGIRCEEPVHRDVLDYLAWYLQDQNWSIKALHRLILNSRTYQQQSWDRPVAREQDPENRLYWRMNRRRKDWESLRDSLYAVAGQLDLTQGGPAIDMFRSQPSNRRSVYGTIDRQDLPNLLRSFDFASPDSSSAQRPETTVPQQALFLMNGEMVGQLSEQLLQQEGVPPADQPDQRLAWLFDRIYLREMTGDEYETCRQFVDQIQVAPEHENPEQARLDATRQRWLLLVQAMLMSNEFCFID